MPDLTKDRGDSLETDVNSTVLEAAGSDRFSFESALAEMDDLDDVSENDEDEDREEEEEEEETDDEEEEDDDEEEEEGDKEEAPASLAEITLEGYGTLTPDMVAQALDDQRTLNELADEAEVVAQQAETNEKLTAALDGALQFQSFLSVPGVVDAVNAHLRTVAKENPEALKNLPAKLPGVRSAKAQSTDQSGLPPEMEARLKTLEDRENMRAQEVHSEGIDDLFENFDGRMINAKFDKPLRDSIIDSFTKRYKNRDPNLQDLEDHTHRVLRDKGIRLRLKPKADKAGEGDQVKDLLEKANKKGVKVVKRSSGRRGLKSGKKSVDPRTMSQRDFDTAFTDAL